jgi:parvulin-like peptidyl-prolyl isomerase
MSLGSFGRSIKTGPLGKVLFALVCLCMGVLAFTGLGSSLLNRQPATPEQQTPSDVVATVDGVPIHVAQFQNGLEQLKEQQANYGAPPPSVIESSYIRAQAFNQLLSPILASQLAKERGLTVSDSDIQAERNKELTPIRTELSLPADASDDDVSAALENHGVSLDDVVNSTAIRTQLLAEKYEQDVNAKSAATDAVVRNYYLQVHTRHILISNKTRPDAQALALAKNLIARLDKGADFVALAKQYSDDPGTKDKGGDDGFIDQSTSYVPEFKTAALALKPPQITQQPVATSEFGYFIIQALAARSNLPKDYAKNHQQYAAQVTQTLAQQTMQSDLSTEKAKATVVVKDSRLKADLAVSNLQQNDPNRNGVLNSALAEYNQALNNGDDADKAEIYASMAQVYQMLGQPDNEMAQIKLALNNIVDSSLYVMLGDLYKQKGDVADALIQYQNASDHSYDDPDIHTQVMQDFKVLNHPKLVAKESAWLAAYQSRQKQAMASPPLSVRQ